MPGSTKPLKGIPLYPNQPQGYAQPYPPQFPQQPAAPAYPQQPPAPSYPQQYAPAPAYPQQYPQAPAGYAQPYPQPPAQPLPTGTLDAYYSQPSTGGGPSWKFNGKPVGTSYAGIVARPLGDGDVRAQTNNAGQVQTYRDGRPKFVMVVPMQVQPSPEFPDGVAGWWVKGQARDELARAMAEAGAPEGAPEAGAGIRVTLVGQRQVPNMNPQLLYRIEYMRPSGAQQAAATAGQAISPHQPMPQQPMGYMTPDGPVIYDNPSAQYAQQPMPPQMTASVMSTATGQPVVHQQPVPAPAAVVQQPPVAQPVAAQPAAAPAGFNAEQAALFAKLTGQTPQA
jgi:hypothetical protein